MVKGLDLKMGAITLDRIIILLSLIGLIVSIYLVTYQYAGVPLECPETGIIDCATVLASPYSTLLGVHLSVYGVFFFILEMLVLRYKKELLVAVNAAGIGFVFYFLYAEYMVGKICIYCTTVHVVVAALFLISVYEFLKS